MKKNLIVNIADMKMSDSADYTVSAFSLGASIAVVLYEPLKKVGGIANLMLPFSRVESHRVAENPFKFVDTGLPNFFNEFFRIGCKKKDILVSVFGGSQLIDISKNYSIGERNYVAVSRILTKSGIRIFRQDVGGHKSINVSLDLETGGMTILKGTQHYRLDGIFNN